MLPLLNRAWEMSTVNAIAIAEKLNIPIPVRLPRLVSGDSKDEVKKTKVAKK